MSCYFSIHPEQCKHSVVLSMGEFSSVIKLKRLLFPVVQTQSSTSSSLFASWAPWRWGLLSHRMLSLRPWDKSWQPEPSTTSSGWLNLICWSPVTASSMNCGGWTEYMPHSTYLHQTILRVALTKKGVRFGHPLGNVENVRNQSLFGNWANSTKRSTHWQKEQELISVEVYGVFYYAELWLYFIIFY